MSSFIAEDLGAPALCPLSLLLSLLFPLAVVAVEAAAAAAAKMFG